MLICYAPILGAIHWSTRPEHSSSPAVPTGAKLVLTTHRFTEAIVTETLTPVVYIGPSDGIPREQWQLKSPAELLDLKICDPAMGSGAFGSRPAVGWPIAWSKPGLWQRPTEMW